MKKLLSSIILFSVIFLNAQNKELSGKWIIDRVLYQGAKSLEINNDKYSEFGSYFFTKNMIIANSLQMPYKIEGTTLLVNDGKINFAFEDDYLLLQNQKEKTISLLLSPESFLKKYPEFNPKRLENFETNVYEENLVVTPDFVYEKGFWPYIAWLFDSYEKFKKQKFAFKFQYVVTKDNKIKNLKITDGATPEFDNLFLDYFQKAEIYYNNTSGKDIFVERIYKFNQEYFSSFYDTDKEEFILQRIYKNGKDFYDKNDFEKAIKALEKINKEKIIKEDSGKKQIYKLLGISYLALNKNSEACINFRKAGTMKDFSVRNYLKDFCYVK